MRVRPRARVKDKCSYTAATMNRYYLIQCAHSNAIILNYVPSKDCEKRYDSFMALLDLLPEAQAKAITENIQTIRGPSGKHTLD